MSFPPAPLAQRQDVMTAPLWEHRCCTAARLSPKRICPQCYAIAETYAWAVPIETLLRLRVTPDGPLVSIAGPVLAPDIPRPAPAAAVVASVPQTPPAPPPPPPPAAPRCLAAPMQPPPRVPTPAVRPPGARPHRPHEDDKSRATAPRTSTAEPESPIKGVFGTAMVLIGAGLIVAGVTASSPESSAVLMSMAAILMVVFLPLVSHSRRGA